MLFVLKSCLEMASPKGQAPFTAPFSTPLETTGVHFCSSLESHKNPSGDRFTWTDLRCLHWWRVTGPTISSLLLLLLLLTAPSTPGTAAGPSSRRRVHDCCSSLPTQHTTTLNPHTARTGGGGISTPYQVYARDYDHSGWVKFGKFQDINYSLKEYLSY